MFFWYSYIILNNVKIFKSNTITINIDKIFRIFLYLNKIINKCNVFKVSIFLSNF